MEILMARDLPKMDGPSGLCDPNVILSISSQGACLDQSDKRAKVEPQEQSPVGNQSFMFKPIEFRNEFVYRNAVLVLTVMEAENYGNDYFMGEIVVPLVGIDTAGWVEKWYKLTDPEKKAEAGQLCGSVLVRTKFIYGEKRRRTPNDCALEEKKTEVVAFLESKGAQSAAARARNTELIEGEGPGENWWKAAREGKLEVVRTLIELGGRVSLRTGKQASTRSVEPIMAVLPQPLSKSQPMWRADVPKAPACATTDNNKTVVAAYLKSKGGTINKLRK